MGESDIKESSEVSLLGVLIDNKLNFKGHLNDKIKKANLKIVIIKRNQHYLTFHQKKIVLSSFVHCHFFICTIGLDVSLKGIK